MRGLVTLKESLGPAGHGHVGMGDAGRKVGRGQPAFEGAHGRQAVAAASFPAPPVARQLQRADDDRIGPAAGGSGEQRVQSGFLAAAGLKLVTPDGLDDAGSGIALDALVVSEVGAGLWNKKAGERRGCGRCRQRRGEVRA